MVLQAGQHMVLLYINMYVCILYSVFYVLYSVPSILVPIYFLFLFLFFSFSGIHVLTWANSLVIDPSLRHCRDQFAQTIRYAHIYPHVLIYTHIYPLGICTNYVLLFRLFISCDPRR